MTKQELIRAMKRESRPVDDGDLTALVGAGLLQRPRQVHVRGLQGSESHYPDGTLEQLIAVYDLREHERRFDELRFDVWWAGHWVDPTMLRTSLTTLLDHDAERLRREVGDLEPFEAAETIVAKLPSKPRDPTLRVLRRRVDGDAQNLGSAMFPILVQLFGGQPIWDAPDVGTGEPSPAMLTARLLGFDQLAGHRLDGAEPLLAAVPDVRKAIQRLADAGVLTLTPSAALKHGSDAQLAEARELAHALCVVGLFAQAVELRHGHDAAGLRPLSITAKSPRSPRLACLRLAVQFPEWSDDPVVQINLQGLRDVAPLLEAVIDLAAEHPGYRAFFRADGSGAMSVDDLDAESREHVYRTMREVVDRNPQMRPFLEDTG